LAEAGAAVAVNYRERADCAKNFADEQRKTGVPAITVPADVSQIDAVAKMVEIVISELGQSRHPDPTTPAFAIPCPVYRFRDWRVVFQSPRATPDRSNKENFRLTMHLNWRSLYCVAQRKVYFPSVDASDGGRP
jgi:NAD(P)-dependent dehydrogenase (short-subunit alcohol dehydrogenase family)